MPQISLIQNESSFKALAPDWDALCADAIDISPFMRHRWLWNWWRAYHTDQSPTIYTVHENDTLLGIAPMMRSHIRHLGRRIEKLQFLGDGTEETDHIQFIIKNNAADSIPPLLLDAVEKDTAWRFIDLGLMPAHSRITHRICRWIKQHRWACHVEDVPCPVQNLPDSYDRFLASLQPRFRTKLRSVQRTAQKAFKPECIEITKPEHLDSALDLFFEMHGARWKLRNLPGSFADPQRRDFYRYLATDLLAAGRLRFFQLLLGDTVAATEFCFEEQECIYLLQEAFDPAFSRYHAGHLLRSMVIRRLIDERKSVYNFLAYQSRHKLLWSNNILPYIRVFAARDPLLGATAILVPDAVRKLVRGLRRVLPAAISKHLYVNSRSRKT